MSSLFIDEKAFFFKAGVNFIWTVMCQDAFEEIKSILCSEPVLLAPDCDKQFKLYLDTI